MRLLPTRIVLLLCLFILVAPGNTSAKPLTGLFMQNETPSPSPTPDVELERLTREAQLAAQKKAKSEAERDATKADIEAAKNRLGIGDASPKASASPPAG